MRNAYTAWVLSLLFAASASAATFTVTNTNDSGPGSLRQAIIDSNSSGTPATIVFSIGSGPQTITPQTVLPFITNQVTIDATTQPGYAGRPLIRLDGSSSTVAEVMPEHGGLVLHAAGSSVSGFSITSWRVLAYFKGSEGAGVIVAAPNCVVKKNYLGIALDGQTAAGNDSGVRLDSSGALIGGMNEGNIVGGNTHGITHWRASGGANVIQDNIVGVDASGTVPLPNLLYGIFVGGDANVIGNTVNHNQADMFLTGTGNIVLGNKIGYARPPGQFSSEPGVLIYPGFANTASTRFGGPNPGDGNDVTGSSKGILLSSSSGSVVQGNTIHGNGFGVFLEHSSGTRILGNTITNNSDTAIRVYTGDGNTISRNSLYDNYAGIFLGFFYPLPNDPGDTDGGQNLGQNYPVITSAKLVNGQTVISGTLNSTANSAFTIELFGSPACNGSGYGEGKTFAGLANVVTNASGNASFSVTSGAMPMGTAVTGTATDVLGNTSQFSACASVEGAGAFSIPAAASVVEGSGSTTITVTRTAPAAGPASVSYTTANGTASAGSDYTVTAGTLNFADGETSKTITIPIVDDAVYEGSETFTLQLTAPTNGATIAAPGTTTVTISDDETAPRVSIADAQLSEGNSGTANMMFAVSLSGATTTPAIVQYATSGNTASAGSDFQSVNGAVTFNPGETLRTISVPIVGDTVREPDETFTVSLASPINVTIARGSASGTIVNDDGGGSIAASDVRIVEGNDGTTNAVITLVASQPVTAEVDFFTVEGTAKSRSDFTPRTSFVTFNNETTKTITVPIIGDTFPELDETFTVQLSIDPLNFPASGVFLARSVINVTIVNDDAGVGPAQLSIPSGSISPLVVNLGGNTAQQVRFTSSNPDVATVPEAVQVTGTAFVNVTGVSAGYATITATLPGTAPATTIDVFVYDRANLVLTPAAWTLTTGSTATISAKFNPALSVAEEATLTTAGFGVITMPDRVTIGPGETATFTIQRVARGRVLLSATLGTLRGNAVTSIVVDVVDPITTAAITSFTPYYGSVAGGTPVLISGSNFRPDCTIRFGAMSATNVRFLSSGLMSATTPPNAAGNVDVSIACGFDLFISAGHFQYLGPPLTLHSVVPAAGTTVGGTDVAIFAFDYPGCWPFFDGIPARAVNFSSGYLAASTPAHPAAAAVPVVLRCPGFSDALLPGGFTYAGVADPPPVITRVAWFEGVPGGYVHIFGTDFRLDDVFAFDGFPARIINDWKFLGERYVRVPDLPPGMKSITVTDSRGRASTTGPVFRIKDAPAPRITRVTPTITRPSNEVVLDGNFRTGYTFTIGDQPATLVTMDDTYDQVVLRVPRLDAGSYSVKMLNAASEVVAVGPQLTLLAAGLEVTRVSPVCVSTEGGVRMTVNGSGFAPGAIVTFDGTSKMRGYAGEAAVVDEHTITFTVPRLGTMLLFDDTPGLTVTNPNGDSASLTNAFSVISPFDPNGCTPRARPARH